jgi:hypothetical protein
MGGCAPAMHIIRVLLFRLARSTQHDNSDFPKRLHHKILKSTVMRLQLFLFGAHVLGAAVHVAERGDGASARLVSRDYDTYAVASIIFGLSSAIMC